MNQVRALPEARAAAGRMLFLGEQPRSRTRTPPTTAAAHIEPTVGDTPAGTGEST